MSLFEIKNVSKSFGDLKVLNDITVSVDKGEVVAIIGPSGSGKSTLLRCATMLETMDSGELIYHGEKAASNDAEGKAVYASNAELRKIKSYFGLVFQQFNLFPHYDVLKNLCDAPIHVQKRNKTEVVKEAMALIAKMGLEGKEHYYPQQLSGGQQQRVAIARAISSEPDLLLLDEPLSNLDAKLRVDMRTELKRLHTETKTTMIYVTHDQTEALTMSTKIALFRMGEIVQIGKPLDLYRDPANLYVADFIGSPKINLIDAKAVVDESGMHLDSVLGRFDFPKNTLTEDCRTGSFDAVIGIRSEHMKVYPERHHDGDLEAKIYISMPEGSETLNTVKIGDQSLVIKSLGITDFEADQDSFVWINLPKVNVFDKESELLIKRSV